jgi:type III secretory pathway component EscS
MELEQIIPTILLVFMGGCVVIVLGVALWSLFDHSKWAKNSNPSFDARIIDIQTDNVQYVKDGAKYKTTVYFSDGFIFTTHETNREDGIFSYQISIDADLSEQIINNAVVAHKEAVYKKIGKHRVEKKTPARRGTPKNNSVSSDAYHKKSQNLNKQCKRESFPIWLQWLLEPHNIVAILGIIVSIVLNICIPQENTIYLASALLLILIEYFLTLVLRVTRGIPGNIFAVAPFFIAAVLSIVVSIIFQNVENFDGYDLLARFMPFAAAISLSMWIKHIGDNW